MSVEPGLCGTCGHARVVRSDRGSVFRLCERSRTDPAYRRYPLLPVLACAGYSPRERDDVSTSEAEEGEP